MNKQDLQQWLSHNSRKLDRMFPEGWFLAGSAFLLMNDYINRDINDIDITTINDHYYDGKDSKNHSLQFKFRYLGFKDQAIRSGKFFNDEGKLVSCFKILIDNINVDVFYNPLVKSDNDILKQVLRYKVQFTLENTLNKMAEYRISKHCEDLRVIGLNDLQAKNIIDHYNNKYYPSNK